MTDETMVDHLVLKLKAKHPFGNFSVSNLMQIGNLIMWRREHELVRR